MYTYTYYHTYFRYTPLDLNQKSCKLRCRFLRWKDSIALLSPTRIPSSKQKKKPNRNKSAPSSVISLGKPDRLLSKNKSAPSSVISLGKPDRLLNKNKFAPSTWLCVTLLRYLSRRTKTLILEQKAKEEELLAYWWKEYAECSGGLSGSHSTSKDTESDDLYQVEEERVGVPVKGGLYELDLMRTHYFHVYWNGENRRMLRGHLYAKAGPDWIPLCEDVAEQLELAYQCQAYMNQAMAMISYYSSATKPA